MKIISKRGKVKGETQEVDIELDFELDLSDFDTRPVKDPAADDTQQEFEYYNEDWVIQGFTNFQVDFIAGLHKMQAWCIHNFHEGVWTVYYRKQEICRFTDTVLCESDVSTILNYVRDIIDFIKTEE